MEDMDLKALYDGNFYHVCTNGLEQVTLLKDEEDFRTAWNYLALSAWRIGVEIVAFTLMSNHVHEILACKDASDANTAIKLFYMKNCIAYILRNAVCARICARPEDYRWASYACCSSTTRHLCLNFHEFLDYPGN